MRSSGPNVQPKQYGIWMQKIIAVHSIFQNDLPLEQEKDICNAGGCIWICLITIKTQTLHLKGNISIGMLLLMTLLGQVFGRWSWTRWCISVRDRRIQGQDSSTGEVSASRSQSQLSNPHAVMGYHRLLVDVYTVYTY